MTRARRRLQHALRLPVLLLILLRSQAAYAIIATYCSSINTANGPPDEHYMFMSEGECRKTCEGYSYGITQGFDCWCSNLTPGTTTSLSNCDSICPGFHEYCGSVDKDLFNYLFLGRKPDGVSGGGGGSGGGDSNSTPTNSTPTTTVTKTPPVDPVTRTKSRTITRKETVKGSVTTRSTTIVKTHVHTVTSTPTSILPSSIATTLTQVLTVNGVTTTQTTTSYATAPPYSGATPAITETHSGLSGGAVAGITIGVIAAVAILGLLVYFCCWRRSRTDQRNGEERGLGRNTSVLSKSGLLRHGSSRHREATGPNTATTSTITSNRPPRLQTDIPAVASGAPSSAATGGTMTSRRDSRPLFVDQRLNPNALTAHENPSRTSVSTLHDDKDYSRPLEVRNPDPPSRPI